MNRHVPRLIAVVGCSLSLVPTGHTVGTLETQATGYPQRNAEYTTTHVFIDEVQGHTENIHCYFTPGLANISDVEIFTNLNRRHLARVDKNGDGYADGIQPIDGDSVTDTTGDTSPVDGHYYIPINMLDDNGDGTYECTVPASRSGAYRLTARFKVSDAISANGFDPANWIWGGLRDHAIVVSPVDAREIRLYEINVFNIEASGDTFATRSTLEDLHNAPGAAHNANNRWDLDYLKGLGMNWLWFQPIHPNGIDGREPSDGWGGTGAPYDPGSPYAVKNFFEVNELMSMNYHGANTIAQNRAAAMTAFVNLVAAADAEGVGIMLDAPFNHTAFDVELAQVGVDLFQPDGQSWSPGDEIRSREARFFSRDGNYGNRAFDAGSIAAGPDRFDFGKWNDVKDVFFGRYDALVEFDAEPERSSYTSEGDWFDLGEPDWTSTDFTQGGAPRNVTRLTWDYFAEYALFWLTRSGYPAGTPHTEANRDRGIDGLRCDFGQGLPPRAWEYIINVARTRKWNFVMMSESLDGGAVTYRSNRHFDILNENITFPLNAAGDKHAYRAIFDERRTAYGQGLVLLNNTSHDEAIPGDPWESVLRSAVVGMMDGATMIFPGQELGIAGTFGYSHYELNFGKDIPHFKRWNTMMPAWQDNDFGNDQLYPVYAGIQAARKDSPALTSSHRWFLDGDTGNPKIFAAAKYTTAHASPAFSDVVLGFVNIDRDSLQSDTFKIPGTLAALLGIGDSRSYNVKNLAAYTAQQANRRDHWLWGSAITGADLKASGFPVSIHPVPTVDATWSTEPYEAHYLKLYDTTPPPAPTTPANVTGQAYVFSNKVTFTWSASPANTADDNITGYRLVIKRVGTDMTVFDQVIGELTAYEYIGQHGDQLYAQVIPVSAASIEGAASSPSSPVELINPDDDTDGDGQSNIHECIAGTDPFNHLSVFMILEATTNSSGQLTLSWPSVSGKVYGVQSLDLLPPASWNVEDGNIVGTGNTISWSDPGHPLPALQPAKFYRVTVE